MTQLATLPYASTENRFPTHFRPSNRHEHRIPPSRDTRHLTVLFRRNPDQDGQRERVRYEGYEIYWPNGQTVTVGFQRFCQQGSRLLGLGRRMRGKEEQLVSVGLHPLESLEDPLTRLGPGIRSRRFYIERQGQRGRIFFFNGSPTDMEFDVEQDDPRVLNWLGLRALEDGELLWFDLSAQSLTDEEAEVELNHLAG